ncbi:unnamed protein product [Caenorhabditis angaria]|uniref:Glycosyltransferase family 92 protein n=1 Tax=Caenorhabditis angaria TaxID=860376 RepID=A0A9P1N6X5_9PELO|nr:unnamed protein product [Caenorhabditis angaria]
MAMIDIGGFCRRRKFFIVLFAASILVYLLLFTLGDEASKSEKIRENSEEQIKIPQTHTFIHNVYYYPKSTSLGENALAFVMAMDKRAAPDITKHRISVIGTDSQGNERKTNMTLTVEAVENARCDYQMTLGQTNTINDLRILEIESDENGSRVQIPFKLPKKHAPSPVIFCISPQFVAEQWQAFLAQVHVSKRFGAHLHIYIVSILDSYYNLLKQYEKRGYITIDQWLNIKFAHTSGDYLEPNRNVELRNQAAAQTDCLLQYKQSAHYIAFLDMDDLIMPSRAGNYYEEFVREFQGNPLISAIYYEKYDFEVEKVPKMTDQSISAIVRSAKLLKTKDLGKPVVRPIHYNSTWLHYSMNANTKENKRWTRGVKNGVFHFKKMNMAEPKDVSQMEIPKALVRDGSLISEEHLNEIDRDLENLMEDPEFRRVATSLPNEEFYMPIVFDCYNKSFYHRRELGLLDTTKLCINAYDCVLPQREDKKCIHSDAIYQSGPPMYPITFHFAKFYTFSENIGCYQ